MKSIIETGNKGMPNYICFYTNTISLKLTILTLFHLEGHKLQWILGRDTGQKSNLYPRRFHPLFPRNPEPGSLIPGN